MAFEGIANLFGWESAFWGTESSESRAARIGEWHPYTGEVWTAEGTGPRDFAFDTWKDGAIDDPDSFWPDLDLPDVDPNKIAAAAAFGAMMPWAIAAAAVIVGLKAWKEL